MLTTKIEPDFQITIPEPLRPNLSVGDELLISADQQGRIILVPTSRVRAILEQTAGMWRGRQDIPGDGVEYVNNLRQGRRLNDLGVVSRGD
jgi:bifunctional DNA-binding transcriptional regulator/antitoxin component of YhaV-PrlF toxin-antitoxin module